MDMTPRPYRAVCFEVDGTLLPMDIDEFMQGYFSSIVRFAASRGFDAEGFLTALKAGIKAMATHDGARTNEDVFWEAFGAAYGAGADEIRASIGDYYNGAFTAIGGFLTGQHADNAYAMVGYRLHNAMTEHGSVARGVCELRDGYLTGITERTHIEKRGDDAAFTEDGEHFTPLSGDTTVSMNFWGFTPRILDELAAEFPRFLQESVSVNPLKAEFYLPTVANNQLAANRATVRVLNTD